MPETAESDSGVSGAVATTVGLRETLEKRHGGDTRAEELSLGTRRARAFEDVKALSRDRRAEEIDRFVQDIASPGTTRC
jgi:hypothetical protein